MSLNQLTYLILNGYLFSIIRIKVAELKNNVIDYITL